MRPRPEREFLKIRTVSSLRLRSLSADCFHMIFTLIVMGTSNPYTCIYFFFKLLLEHCRVPGRSDRVELTDSRVVLIAIAARDRDSSASACVLIVCCHDLTSKSPPHLFSPQYTK